jgi:hypothetical protein
MSDVEDFLRRVAQMRAEAQAKARQANQPRPAQQRPPQQRPAEPPPPPPRERPAPVTRRLEPIAAPVQAEVVEAQIVDRANEVERRVRDHLRGTEEIAEHTRHLGEQVDQADDKLAAHLHQMFDHQVGDLKQSGGAQAAKREQVTPEGLSPEAISRLLRSPTAARDAVILAEILQRPEQRWQ